MPLHRAAINLLSQLDEVISQLTDTEYSMPIPILSEASIGEHTRHSLEFFICLIEARMDGILNYDKRKRDKRIEQDVVSARNILGSIQKFLSNRSTNFPVNLQACYEVNSITDVSVPSTFYRELAYNLEHTVHHMALIKVALLTVFKHVRIPENFGVAISTIRHHKGRKTE